MGYSELFRVTLDVRAVVGYDLAWLQRYQLAALAAKSAHRVTGVASFILLANIGNQHLWALYLDFEGGDQGIFRVNDNVFRFPLKFKADRKLHLRSPLWTLK
jgi:hypothetical protein